MKSVLLITRGDTWAGLRCASWLHACESVFTDHLISSLIDEFFRLTMLIPGNALISRRVANDFHDRIAPRNACQFTDLSCSGLVIHVAKAMHVGEVGLLEAECARFSVHFLDESIDS